MLCAAIACALLPYIESSEHLAPSFPPAITSYKSMYVSRNGVARQQLAVDASKTHDHQIMRRASMLPCTHGQCRRSFAQTRDLSFAAIGACSGQWTYTGDTTGQDVW